MIDANTVIVIAAIICPLVTSFLSFMASNRNGGKIDNLHKQLNSRLSELIETVRAQSHAQGVLEGRSQIIDTPTEKKP
jgi:hypothetical protein